MARRINLVPASERARTATNVGLLGLIAGIIIVIFGLGFGYYLLNNSLNDREQQLADVQQQRMLVESQAASLQQYELLASERSRTERLVQQAYAGRTIVADILDAVSLVVPESVWFQNLSLRTADPGPATAAGTATQSQSDSELSLDGSTYTFEDVSSLLVRLQLIPALSEIDLDSAANEGEEGETKAFSMTAAVRNTQDPDVPLPVSQVEVKGL